MIYDTTSCNQAACPMKERCSRYTFYLKAKAESDTLTILNPDKIEVGPNGCEHFIVPMQIRQAYGFTRLYDTIPRGQLKNIHWGVRFGSDSTYFRTKRGDRALSPQEQTAILRAVAQAGGDPSVGFDRYVDAIIYVRVMDPERAYFEVSNYRQATVALAQTSLRGIIGDMELDEILYNRDLINTRLRDILDKETDQWGVKIERVEIKEVNPIGAVKQAMTEQTAAERERRAAILKADGEKRAAILKAEGLRQSMILESEGERQSKILRAEGERQSQILKAQGEAQGLRILALGSRALDKRSVTVLSLDTMQKMADGQATKIIYPFEVSSLIKQGAKFLGGEDAFEPNETPSVKLDESILGDLPDKKEIAAAVEQVKKASATENKVEE